MVLIVFMIGCSSVAVIGGMVISGQGSDYLQDSKNISTARGYTSICSL